MAAVWAAGPEPMIATEECILRRKGRVLPWDRGSFGDGGVAVCGRIVEVARRGRVAAERRVVKRRKVEENVIAVLNGRCL